MSHYMTALAMRQKGLKPAAKIVLYWLADHHNGDTGQCNPSIKRLSECCEMSRRSVENHITTLESAGIVEVKRCFRDGGGKAANRYKLLLVESNAQILRMGSAKSAHGVCAKSAHDRTLEYTNHINEPRAGSDEPDLFSDNPVAEKPEDDSIKAGFKEFWEDIWPRHPRKTGRADCEKVYGKICTGDFPKYDEAVSPENLNNAARAYIAQEDQNDKLKYLKGPLPWLRQPGWEPFLGAGSVKKPETYAEKIIRQYGAGAKS